MFRTILTMFVVMLMVLPLTTTFNESLTRIVEGMFWYRWLQTLVVPYESRILAGILSLIPGIEAYSNIRGVELNGMQVYVTWNCIGWQSFILFLFSIAVGFGKNFTRSSQLFSLLFGICGLFLLNVFRLSLTAFLALFSPRVFTLLFHNYLAALLTIGWLMFFWWFSYAYLLDEKNTDVVPSPTDEVGLA